MKNLRTFEEFVNESLLEESNENLTVSVAASVVKSLENDLNNNKVIYSKKAPTVFIIQNSPKGKMAIQLAKERFGSKMVLITESENLNEAKMNGAKMVKIMSDPENWGPDMKDRVYTKGNNFVFIDTFYYGEKAASEKIVKSWSPGGDYYEYFKDDYGVEVEIVDTFSELKAKGRHKKVTDDGIVGVELAIKESIEESNSESIPVVYKNKEYWVDAKDLNNSKNTKVFAFEDPGLEKIATMNGKSLMFRIDDIEDKLKETINESIKVIDDYKYQVSKKEPKIGDWVLKFKQVNSWEFKSSALKEKDYQYFPVKVVLKSFLEPEDLLIVATNNPKLTNDGVKILK